MAGCGVVELQSIAREHRTRRAPSVSKLYSTTCAWTMLDTIKKQQNANENPNRGKAFLCAACSLQISSHGPSQCTSMYCITCRIPVGDDGSQLVHRKVQFCQVFVGM